MRQALTDPDLFGPILGGETWLPWRALLIATFGEDLTADERAIFTSLTGREREPPSRVDELWCVIGRRGGKTRAATAAGAYVAALCDHEEILAPGERGVLPIMSASTWQAGKAFAFLSGLFASVPALRALVTNETADTLSLSNNIDIECRPASFRTIRSITAIAVIADEVAFWRDDTSRNPDTEILNAARPALATTGGPLIVISSPYARRGELWNVHRRDYGEGGDPLILVAKAASRTMNPALSQKVVDRAYEKDASAASAEFGGEFRSDVETFVSREAVEAVVDIDVTERPPTGRAKAFVDAAGGSGTDSMTMAIGHEEDGVAVVDAIRERRPVFSPEDVVTEFAGILKAYGVGEVTGDRFAGEWPRERFREHGITYEVGSKVKSDLYRDLLPAINSQRVRLLDNDRLIAQLVGLERRTARGGRDTIDHAPRAHDDIANAVAGLVSLCGGGSSYDSSLSWIGSTDEEETRRIWNNRQIMASLYSSAGRR